MDLGLEVLEAMKSNEEEAAESRHVKIAGEELGPHTRK
jgi:choline transport protein